MNIFTDRYLDTESLIELEVIIMMAIEMITATLIRENPCRVIDHANCRNHRIK